MLELREHRAYWQGQRVELTIAELAIVRCLSTQPGHDKTYRQLYDAVRGMGFRAGTGTDGFHVNVRGFIKRIRKKFCDVDPSFDAIENYQGFGYCWRMLAKTPHVLREVG